MKKQKLLALALALLMLCLLTACGGGGGEVKGEMVDAGNVKGLLPDGWKFYPALDIWADDPEATDPNALRFYKGAEDEWDVLSCPAVNVDFYSSDITMLTPDPSWYQESEDIEAFELGGKSWEGFSCKSMGTPMIILWSKDADGNQYQVSIVTEMQKGSIKLEDAEVQAIIQSLEASK